MKNNKAVTLVALIITIIILLILAGVVIAMTVGDEGIITKSQQSVEQYNIGEVREKVNLMLGEYLIESRSRTITLKEYLNEQTTKGNLDDAINNKDETITVDLDGYEVTIKEDDLSITHIEKAIGVRPKFEVIVTKTNGGKLTERAMTVNIINIGAFKNLYKINVQDKDGNDITAEPNVISGISGQASYIIKASGDYTITVEGTNEGIKRQRSKIKDIDVSVPPGLYRNGALVSSWDTLKTNNKIRVNRGSLSYCYFSSSDGDSFVISDEVTEIQQCAFQEAEGLTDIIIPETVTYIAFLAFYNCSSLRNLTIPTSVTRIDDGAFNNNTHIYYNGTATGAPWGAKAIN